MTDDKRKEITEFNRGKMNEIMTKNPIEKWREKLFNQLRQAESFILNLKKLEEQEKKNQGE